MHVPLLSLSLQALCLGEYQLVLIGIVFVVLLGTSGEVSMMKHV